MSQLREFKGRLRGAFAGVESGSTTPGYAVRSLSDHAGDLTSGRPDVPRLGTDRESGQMSPEPPLSPAERQRLLAIKKKIDPDGNYVGESVAVLRVFEQIAFLNKSVPDDPVLILGPTGAGKTEIAELIHRHSRRPRTKFRREQAADNRLGDFTSAKGRWVGYGKDHGFQNIPKAGRTGNLQDYAGGTVFVDEVADLTMEFQGSRSQGGVGGITRLRFRPWRPAEARGQLGHDSPPQSTWSGNPGRCGPVVGRSPPPSASAPRTGSRARCRCPPLIRRQITA